MIINKDQIRIILLLLFLFFLPKVFCQERAIHQPDSIYKANKIKSIKLYNGGYLMATVLCDKEGRWIEYKGEPVTSGWQRSEFFEYDEKGKLIKQFERIKDNGITIFNTEIEYSKDELKKLTKYNPDKTLNSVEHFENKGRKKIRELYNNGLIFQQTTIEYIDDFNEKKTYGWWINQNSKMTEWISTFDYKFENGLVKQCSRYDNGKKRITYYLK